MVPKFQKLHTGDILVTQSEFPFIQHFGVVVVEGSTTCVWHCTPDRHVSLDTLVEFLSKRELKEIRKTGATAHSIYNKLRDLKLRKWNAVNFNCIHFAECLTG